MNIENSQQILLFRLFISIILCFNPAVTGVQTLAALEIEESEEFENSLVRNVRDDYRNGFVEMLKFINSINNTLAALNAKFATQDSKFVTLNDKIDNVNTKLSTMNIKLTVLHGKVDGLTLRTNILTNNKIASQMNSISWKQFDSLIRTQAKEIKTGKFFNGSTLSEIKSRAAQVGYEGRHNAIVFVNHLDEAIGDFTIYEELKFMYNPAPNSVPGRTQEVFTFAPLIHGADTAFTSFSYVISSFGIRVAAISYGGTFGVGLAFVPKGTDMKTYYESRKGIEGSTAYESGNYINRNLSVGYKNLYARIFADDEGNRKATLRIELIKLPLDD